MPRGADHDAVPGTVPGSPARGQVRESPPAMSANARREALDRPSGPQSGESDRDGPALDRDPYRDEGGEG